MTRPPDVRFVFPVALLVAAGTAAAGLGQPVALPPPTPVPNGAGVVIIVYGAPQPATAQAATVITPQTSPLAGLRTRRGVKLEDRATDRRSSGDVAKRLAVLESKLAKLDARADEGHQDTVALAKSLDDIRRILSRMAPPPSSPIPPPGTPSPANVKQ